MELKIPFVDETIDLTDPADAGMTAFTIGGGFVAFYLLSDGGRRVANRVRDLAGMGEDGGVEVL